MSQHRYRSLIKLVKEAFALARSLGIPNLLQHGLAKEIIIAEILGHEVMVSKDGIDAHDPADSTISFEYLTCLEGNTGQLDRMIKSPVDERQDSLERIRRNDKIYFAVFYKANQIKVKTIFELETVIVLEEAIRKMDRSKNRISHVGFSEYWSRANGRVVYSDAGGAEYE